MSPASSVRVRFILRPVDERVGDGDLPLLSVSQFRGVVPRSELTSDDPRADDLSKYKVCRPGDIVVNRMSAYQGALGRSEYSGMVSPDYLVLRPLYDVEGRWLHHLVRSAWFVSEMAARIRGIGTIGTGNVRTPRVSAEEIGDIAVVIPPRTEQRTIANFLDTETSRIDAVIFKKHCMVDLLRLKLNCERSRVLWSAQPATLPLKHLTPVDRQIMYGIVLPGPDVPDGVPIVKGGDVAAGLQRLLCKTTPEIERGYIRSRVRTNDLVFAIRGGVGDVAMVTEEVAGANLTQDVARVSPIDTIEPQWLFHVLKSPEVQAQAVQRTTGATIRGLNIWELKQIRVPILETKEQRAQADELDCTQSKIEGVASNLSKQIPLLHEHRQALVTAAVTGKLGRLGVPA